MGEESPKPASSPTGAVFISYASQDADAAKRICDALRRVGVEVWFDQSELRGGDAWDQSIRKQIKTCALFLPIISKHTHERAEGYFRLEWKLAVDRCHLMAADKAFLVPVVIDDTRDDDERVPDKFRELQWTRLPGGNAPPEFVTRVRQLLAGEPGHSQTLVRPSAATPSGVLSSRKSAWLVVAVLLAGLVAYLLMEKPWRLKPAPPSKPARSADTPVAFNPAPHSIAVLPFLDMSERHDEEYFADGLSEELIDQLSRSHELRVIARTSSFYFKGRQATARDIATSLNVGYLLEGSVRRSGKTLRVATQLVRATDSASVWSQTYDRPISDIFKVQTDIATQVAAALHSTLTGTSDQVSGTKDVEAYNLTLEGQFYKTRRNSGDLARAIEAYSRAVKLDPTYTRAWVQLGHAYVSLGLGDVLHRADTERLAIQAVDRAFAIEPDSPSAHRLMGIIERSFRWDWDAAAAQFDRALSAASDPNERVLARLDIGYLDAMRTGHYGMQYWTDLEESLVRNPLDTTLMRELAFDYLFNGQYEKAITLTRRALRINPTGEGGNANLAYALMLASRFEEGLAAAEQEPDEETRWQILAMLTWSVGQHAEADQYLRQLARRQPDQFYTIAQIHVWRGERDVALQWLERAYNARASGMMALKLDPIIVRLREDERYSALLRKMKLPE
jgi:TolB-like protein/tetratricopeptide (TPR) repeat protein